MSTLFIKLIWSLLASCYFNYMSMHCEKKYKEALQSLDNLACGDCGYFSMSQRYYDSRKMVVLLNAFSYVSYILVINYIVDICSLLNL